jgi:hypothetical protein
VNTFCKKSTSPQILALLAAVLSLMTSPLVIAASADINMKNQFQIHYEINLKENGKTRTTLEC